jgi:hypothetical protein
MGGAVMRKGIERSMQLPSFGITVMLIILPVAIMSCSAFLKSGKAHEDISSAAATEQQSVNKEKNRYCEITACIGEIKDECEVRIGIMKNYDATVNTKDGGDYILKVDKAMAIEFLKDWILKGSLTLNRLGAGDKLLYRTYAEENSDYYARHYSSLVRVMRKISVDEQAPGYKFSFRQLFAAAESMLQKDKVQLGQETLMVKKRIFPESPVDPFFASPIQQMELY